MTTIRSRCVLGLATAVAFALALSAVPGGQTMLIAQGDPNTLIPPATSKDLKWRMVGASRGGRVTGFAGVRQQPHTFYAGATGGGVWKTDDAGITWTPIGDGQITTGSIGSIDVAPSNPNHVWVGTGSAAIRSNVIIGRGVFKSTDAGKTFQFMGLKESGQIGGLRVHPTNPEVVWLAALGSPFGPNEERGIFKTADGGKTWKKTLYVDMEHGGRDIEVDWQNPNVLYAAMYRGFRKGWDIISGGPADKGGIYKSTDGGETWKKVSAGLPAKLIGKIDLDIARSSPNVLYAMVEAIGSEGGLYRSSDAGESWTLVNNGQRLRARPFYFHYVSVNPKNENEVFVNELVPDENVSWNLTAIPAAIRIARLEGIDVVLTTSPPTSVHLVGAAVKLATGARWIADLRDSIAANPHRRVESRLVRAKEATGETVARLVARRADAVTAVTAPIAEELQALGAKRVETIANGADFEDFAGLEYTHSERFRLTHTGSFFGRRSPRPILEALAGTDADIVARFVGDFRAADREWAAGLHLGDRLELHPYVPRRRVLELQRDSEALLLLIPESGGRGRAVLSAKVFEYIAAERPILAAVPPDGAAADLIRETGTGVVVAPEDVDGLRETLVRLEGDWRAGKLNGTPLSAEARKRVSRQARVEELAALARSLA